MNDDLDRRKLSEEAGGERAAAEIERAVSRSTTTARLSNPPILRSSSGITVWLNWAWTNRPRSASKGGCAIVLIKADPNTWYGDSQTSSGYGAPLGRAKGAGGPGPGSQSGNGPVSHSRPESALKF